MKKNYQMTDLTGEDAGWSAVILHVIDFPHRAIGVKILPDLLSQEVILSVDLADWIVHPASALALIPHSADYYF